MPSRHGIASRSCRTVTLLLALVGAPARVGAQGDSARLVLQPVAYVLDLGLDLERQEMQATVELTLRNPHATPAAEASLLLHRLLRVTDVADARGRSLGFAQAVLPFEDFTKLQVNHVRIPLRPALAPGREVTLRLAYRGHVLGYAETGMLYVRDRIDSAYSLVRMDAYAYPIPGYRSEALNRKAGLPEYRYRATIRVPATHVVANGGRLLEETRSGSVATYVYASAKPSWRMDFAVAPFAVARRGNLTAFHFAQDSAGARRILDAAAATLALYSRWFGPLRDSMPFAFIELPDGWGSQADVTSILQTAAAFRDSTQEYQVYHEISHLWNVREREPAPPRWNEGLASFLEDLTTDSLKGRATTDPAAARMATWLRGQLARSEPLRTTPMAEYGSRRMTDYSYSVGNLMFWVLHRVVGHATFSRIIGEYHRAHVATGGSSADFARVARSLGGSAAGRILDDWLFSTRWQAALSAAQDPRDLVRPYLPLNTK